MSSRILPPLFFLSPLVTLNKRFSNIFHFDNFYFSISNKNVSQNTFCSGELLITTFIVSGINKYIRRTRTRKRKWGENIGSSRALPRGSFTLLGKPDSRHQPLSQSCGRDGGRVTENNGQRERIACAHVDGKKGP